MTFLGESARSKEIYIHWLILSFPSYEFLISLTYSGLKLVEYEGNQRIFFKKRRILGVDEELTEGWHILFSFCRRMCYGLLTQKRKGCVVAY